MNTRQEIANNIELVNMPLAVDLIRFEKNLLQMGFFGAHDTRHSNQTSRRIEQLANRAGQKIKVAAEFRASQEFGLPSTSDRDKYIAFMRIAMNQRMKAGGTLQNPIRFTGYHLLKELGLSFSGENYEDINRWGQRMVDTSITSEQVIYLAARKKYANKTVHVFRSFTRAGQSTDTGSSRTEAFEVVLEDWLLENLNESYVVPEDFNAYQKLRRPTAKGIFGYLHLWFHASHGRDVEKDYSELCVLLNVPSYKHVSKIKETMGRSLDELVSIDYLARWDIRPMTTKQGYKLVVGAGDQLLRVLTITERKLSKPAETGSIPDGAQQNAIELLTERGITSEKAKSLVRSYGVQPVVSAVQYTDSVQKAHSRRKIENPAGFIIYLLDNAISIPSHIAKSSHTAATVDLHDRYQESIDSEIDRIFEAQYPGNRLATRIEHIANERSQTDDVFKGLPERTRTILAERILRDEVAKEVNLPTFEEWAAQQRQFTLF